ncbi:hypothetical protein J2T57_002129 [Natronocella acetinitrilica]|uniref:Uncharacterized protein n=1 Tax=Natronocella acetinitrilica TaxID=414046 RepID=A0AAE3KBT9_9GAMM|nr:hypothetical protein [Natronocella acetinitrilica]MCP1674991.1 hypothetical protein [Natronocella acetinitrilica]
MDERSTDQRRKAFVMALTDMDRYWGELFGDEVYYDLNYSDLFTRMWLEREREFRKTQLYDLMPKVSHRTAVKYVQRAIDEGLLVERVDPDDLRSKRVSMSAALVSRIEEFLDYSLEVFGTGPFTATAISA